MRYCLSNETPFVHFGNDVPYILKLYNDKNNKHEPSTAKYADHNAIPPKDCIMTMVKNDINAPKEQVKYETQHQMIAAISAVSKANRLDAFEIASQLAVGHGLWLRYGKYKNNKKPSKPHETRNPEIILNGRRSR